MRWMISSAVLAVFAFVLVFASRPAGRDEKSYWSCGEKMPGYLEAAVVQVQEDIKNAKRIVAARQDMMVLLDKDERIKTYEYRHKSLWCNGNVIIHHLTLFYFDYRDMNGLMLRHPEQMPDQLSTVAFAFKRVYAGRELIIHAKNAVMIPRDNASLQPQWLVSSIQSHHP